MLTKENKTTWSLDYCDHEEGIETSEQLEFTKAGLRTNYGVIPWREIDDARKEVFDTTTKTNWQVRDLQKSGVLLRAKDGSLWSVLGAEFDGRVYAGREIEIPPDQHGEWELVELSAKVTFLPDSSTDSSPAS